MNQLLNPDGTPSFSNISDLKTNFEESFAKKQLGATMKSVVLRCLNNIKNNNASEVLTDEKIRGIVKGSIEEVSDKCFTNDELNGSSFIGGLKKVVKEYAGMESQYREDLANAILSTETDKQKASNKIFELFSVENLNFMNKEIKERYSSELESTFATEGEELVTEIGKEVGAAIAEAEEKNVIINETSKVIQDKQDEIREELATIDDDDEEDEDTSDDEEFDDSEDDGEEPIVEDENVTDTDDTSTEGYEFGNEEFTEEKRNEAIGILKESRPKLENAFVKTYESIIKKVSSYSDDEDVKIYYSFDTIDDFKKSIHEHLDESYRKINNGKNTDSVRINLLQVRAMNKSKLIGSLIISILTVIGGIFSSLATFGGLGILLINCIVTFSDSKERNATRVLNKSKRAKKNANALVDVKVKCIREFERNKTFYKIYLSYKINLKKIYRNKAVEDFDNEVEIIENNLDESLVNDIENGKISIVNEDISIDTDAINVQDHTDDGAVGNEDPDQVPTDLTVSEPNLDNPEPETNDDDTISVEGYGTREYFNYKYGNENLGKVVVPLSPTKLDMIEIPKTIALASIFAKGSESQESLRSVITGRLDILGDIVEREHDEELTKKYNDYKKHSLEALDAAADIQTTFNSVGITPYGIIDKEDPTSLYIGAKVYKYLSGNLNVKCLNPKKSFESLNDAIDAAFDIAVLKDKARKATTNDDLIALNKERASREDLFWNNIVGFEGDEEKKDQIKNILQITDLNIDSKALVDTEYLKSINIALDTQKVSAPGKTKDEIHEELFNNSKERIESFLGKDLNPNQLDIIHAMIDGRDTSDYAPTVFEKFIIKLGTDEALEKNGGKDFELGQESAELIKNKAIVLTALNLFVDHTNPMNEKDTKEFKEYIGL